METPRLQQNRKAFKQYKEDVKERGKPFLPHAIAQRHDQETLSCP